MTPLEKRLAFATWTLCHGTDWSTVKSDVGFVLYRDNDKMWLCGYPPEVVAERRQLHGDKAPYITLYKDFREDSMFNIPASADFVSSVILRHYKRLLE